MARALAVAAPAPSRYSIDEVARESYYIPEAAALLIAAATDPEPSERRLRASKALRWLDMSTDVGELSDDVPETLAPFARAVTRVVVECVRGASASDRARLADLLGSVCREAASLESAVAA